MDPGWQRRIVEAIHPGPADEVLEVGPGRGALTRHLAGAVGRLVLVELDQWLALELETTYRGQSSVEVLNRDILDVHLPTLSPDPGILKVIGNIPYNVTTPILFHLLTHPRPAVIVVMVQEEVAARVTAPPGDRTYGALSVGVQAVAAVERLFRVPRGVFRPVPRVDSAVIRITPDRPSRLQPGEEEAFRRLVRACFQWRRKQVGTILRGHPELGLAPGVGEVALLSQGIDPARRPETLSPAEFMGLLRALPPFGDA